MEKSISKTILAVVSSLLVFGLLILHFSEENPSSLESSIAMEQKRPAELKLSESLKDLQWSDLERTLTAGSERDLRENALINKISASRDSTDFPALYLKGLLHMVRHEPQRALESFAMIPVSEIPPRFLYSPYRLQQALHPDEPNPYISTMKEAIDIGVLPELIRARFYSCEGDLARAHAAYLESNPAQWKSYDLTCLTKIARHSGLRSELRFMVQGALNAERVSEPMLQRLTALLASEPSRGELTQAKQILRRELQASSPAGAIALKSMKQILDARTTFLRRDYQTLLELHRQASPILQTTETVLFLFLSALNVKNSLEITRWSQEIKRRHPEPQVLAWTKRLISDSSAL